MTEDIVPMSKPQNEDRQPVAIVPRVAPVFPNSEPEVTVSFAELWGILRKRMWIVAATTCGLFALGLAYTLLVTPRYESAATIQFNKESSDSLALEDPHELLNGANPMDYQLTQQTQINTLMSDTLALQVIHDLNLENRPEFQPKPLWKSLSNVPDESRLPLEKATHRRARVLKIYHKNLRVEAVDGTRIIKISYLSPDANVAADVVNSLVSNYQEQQFRTRFAATAQVSDRLSKQLDDLKDQVNASQEALVQYQKQAGILGTDETHNIVMTRLEEADKQVIDAEGNRILAQAVWQLARSGNPEFISDLAATKSLTDPNKQSLIENLRAQQSQLKVEYAQTAAKYGSSHPKLIQMQRELNQLDANIQVEVQNLATRAQNNFLTAQQNETALRTSFERAKADANVLNDKSVQYSIMKHEAESKRDLYDTLFKQLKEAGVLAGLRSTNIVTVDPARPSDRPAKPVVALNLALALLGGLLVGVAGVFVAENCDDTVKTPEDAEQITMVPALGFIPKWKLRKPLPPPKKLIRPASSIPSRMGALVLSKPHSQIAEAYRIVRTSIMQAARRGTSNVFLVTSALPGEGKTTTALNCAAALAQQDQRVLLVEADMRRSNLEGKLNLDCHGGLSSVIAGGPSSVVPVQFASLPTLSVLPAGPRPSNPAELLGSQHMAERIKEWRANYDFIILDTPPVLSVTDAVVLSAHCDGVILVVRSGVTTKQSLIRVRDLFMRSRKRIVGVVMNAFDLKSTNHYLYMGYKSDPKDARGYYSADVN
ncbi:MAG: polysaccharide biosynthesis tyrosine autokinase [Acidobacteriota bacterium]|nr:polysaccharide biosynthesis tyrosine autokinase [Acidobacteriota bacterium]